MTGKKNLNNVCCFFFCQKGQRSNYCLIDGYHLAVLPYLCVGSPRSSWISTWLWWVCSRYTGTGTGTGTVTSTKREKIISRHRTTSNQVLLRIPQPTNLYTVVKFTTVSTVIIKTFTYLHILYTLLHKRVIIYILYTIIIISLQLHSFEV